MYGFNLLKSIFLFSILLVHLNSQARLACVNLFYSHDITRQGLVIDNQYGVVSQWDEKLKTAQLISDQKSMLCGPTCIYNVLEKMSLNRNEKLIPDKNAAEIVDYVKTIIPQTGGNSDQSINYGMNLETMSKIINLASQQKDIHLDIELRSANLTNENFKKGFTLDELKQSVLPDHAAIVLVGFYRTDNLQEINSTNRIGGHYLIVAGYDTFNPQDLILQDPNRPLHYEKVTVDLVKPKSFNAPTFKIRIEPSFWRKAQTAVIESVILINRSGL